MFLCISDSCLCGKLHSQYPWHSPLAHMRPRDLGLYMLCSRNFNIKLCSNVCFSATVIAARVKHCIVVVLGIFFYYILRPSDLDLYMLCSSDFEIKLHSKVCFSAAVIAASVKNCIVVVIGIPFDQTLSPGPEVIKLFYAQLNWA